MSWSRISIATGKEEKDMCIAWLQYAGIEYMVEHEESIDGFCPENMLEEIMSELHQHIESFEYEISNVPDKNWNAEWESGFEPVQIGEVRVRADFHKKTEGREIIIRPKMAFGTGHHETTYMVIEELLKLSLQDKQVLDYGCGTGILSVMAIMQGASKVTCVDIQQEAVENTIEHFKLNGIGDDKYTVLMGGLESVHSSMFDLVLANINKSVLMETAIQLYEILHTKSMLILSGILHNDGEEVIELYQKTGFNLCEQNRRGEWLCLVFKK